MKRIISALFSGASAPVAPLVKAPVRAPAPPPQITPEQSLAVEDYFKSTTVIMDSHDLIGNGRGMYLAASDNRSAVPMLKFIADASATTAKETMHPVTGHQAIFILNNNTANAGMIQMLAHHAGAFFAERDTDGHVTFGRYHPVDQKIPAGHDCVAPVAVPRKPDALERAGLILLDPRRETMWISVARGSSPEDTSELLQTLRAHGARDIRMGGGERHPITKTADVLTASVGGMLPVLQQRPNVYVDNGRLDLEGQVQEWHSLANPGRTLRDDLFIDMCRTPLDMMKRGATDVVIVPARCFDDTAKAKYFDRLLQRELHGSISDMRSFEDGRRAVIARDGVDTSTRNYFDRLYAQYAVAAMTMGPPGNPQAAPARLYTAPASAGSPPAARPG